MEEGGVGRRGAELNSRKPQKIGESTPKCLKKLSRLALSMLFILIKKCLSADYIACLQHPFFISANCK